MSELGRDIGPPRADHVRKPVGWYLAWVGSCAFGFFGVWYAFQVGLGYDSHAYWLAVQDMGRLYGAPALARDAFLYSPAFAQLIWPLGLLPWPAFYVLWTLLSAVIFVWLLRPLGRTWFAPAFIATLPEIVTGNIYALMAGALVLGVSSGPPWVFLGLTKIAGGGVGLVWLTLTRQWRALVVGLVTAMAVVGLSVAISLDQWRNWIQFLLHGSTPTANSISSPVLTVGAAGSRSCRSRRRSTDPPRMDVVRGCHPRQPDYRTEHPDAARGCTATRSVVCAGRWPRNRGRRAVSQRPDRRRSRLQLLSGSIASSAGALRCSRCHWSSRGIAASTASGPYPPRTGHARIRAGARSQA